MRINKLLSNYGICSRKEANRLIEEGRITVNGMIPMKGQWVETVDNIALDGITVEKKPPIYIVFNKPVGITCTAAEEVKDNIIAYMNYPSYIFPVGRLDKDSHGLIILTNDGEMANRILEADNLHEKEYIVKVDRDIDMEFTEAMARGVEILGVTTRSCTVEKVDSKTFRIILTQGLNRQIRRMCKALGYNVTDLKRIRMSSINLGSLEEGKWRYFSEGELSEIEKL